MNHPMADEQILIVDDDSAIREALRSTLESFGYPIGVASNGVQAVSLLQSQRPWSLILTDLVMPGMNGMSLLEHVQQKCPEIPVILVTGVHDISIALEAIRRGAYDYVLKPFQREQLMVVVGRALEKRRLEAENLSYKNELESLVKARTDLLNHALSDLRRALDERELANRELERSYNLTLEALGSALDLKDAETEGHSRRVTGYTMAIARAMELPHDRREVIGRGAFLHDLGKMAIPDAILRKPGRLTPEEQAVMRDHCELGYRILKPIPFLHEAAEIVYCHQEQYDGRGYPRNLKGDQIPLGARIFAVADAFDAITSDRPYRAAQSISSARREIEKFSGTQFDPAVVRIFLTIPEHFWTQLRDQITGTPPPRRLSTEVAKWQRSNSGGNGHHPTGGKMNTVLTGGEILQALQSLPGWNLKGDTIERLYEFPNFVEAMGFVNRIAEAAETMNHHPDIAVNYNRVKLTLVSHDMGGVTQRDIRMAGKINEITAI